MWVALTSTMLFPDRLIHKNIKSTRVVAILPFWTLWFQKSILRWSRGQKIRDTSTVVSTNRTCTLNSSY